MNADLIAQGVAPFSPETVALRAGRMMLNEIRSLSKRRESFEFETTLSGRSYLGLIRRPRKMGYKVHYFFSCQGCRAIQDLSARNEGMTQCARSGGAQALQSLSQEFLLGISANRRFVALV